jgi:hypothetical protein
LGLERGEGNGWQPVVERHPGCDPENSNDLEVVHLMQPGTLPLQMNELRHVGHVYLVTDIPTDRPPSDAMPSDATHDIPIRSSDNIEGQQTAWQQLVHGQGSVLVPPHTRRRVIIDLQDYYCAYPEIITTGGAGAQLRVNWQESLFDDEKATRKGNRNQIEGKYFVTIWWVRDGVGDIFVTDGGAGRKFETLWWQCGRFVEVLVETGDEPLSIDSFGLRETRYPLEMESRFESSDARLGEVTPIMLRVLQACSHETYMDCPYYEQLQYVGDTRLQVLTTYAITHDDRLPRKALQMFDASRINNGLTQSRYPSRVRQVTRGFALWWVAMLHDYALWRDDMEFVAERMHGARAVLDGYRRLLNADGLVHFAKGPNFNFMDWVPGWKAALRRAAARH